MEKISKVLSITLAVTVTVWLSGVAMLAPVHAAIAEGAVVSPDVAFEDADGETYNPWDVFIIKYVNGKQFKRLVLNPEVFESYGHLNWSDIQTVSADTLKTYTTSTLVRAINDEKVYKLFPSGDTGTKRWVESEDCFNSEGYDWDSVYIINATDRDNYTTGTSMCGGGTEGEINLSLASDNPDASTLPPNAQGVTFLKVRATGSGTINQLTVTRNGAGDTDDFGDIYVYQNGERLVSGRSLSSATSDVTFINLGIEAPATFEIVADMSTGTAGNVNYFSIEGSSDVTADATIGGNFPLDGNPMGISGTNAGTLTIARSGSTSRTVTIGDNDVEISQFKITTSSEGTHIHRIQLINSGTASNNKITNLELRDNTGTTVATADEIGDDGYVTFVFDDPYYIKKGDNEIFRVYADLGAIRPDYTIKLYLELDTDLLGLGTTYGYGMAVTKTDYDSDTYVTVTCKGGDLTLNKVGPNAGQVGDDTDDTLFLEYTMSAAADITIKRTRLLFCSDLAGDGTFDTFASSTAGASNDIEDIKVSDKDSGTILLGTKDGTAFNDGTESNGCATGVSAIYEDFTDTIDISAGESMTLQLTGDIKESNTGTARDIKADTIVKMGLSSYATLVGTSGNVNYMKYTGTTDAVDDSAISPSGNMMGPELTVKAPSLTLSLAAIPTGSSSGSDYQTYIEGQSDVEAVGIIFEAGNASDVTVNSITLTGYISGEGGGAAEWKSGKDTNYVKDNISHVYIYDTTTGNLVPGSSGEGFSGSAVYELVEYTGLDWTIPAGETRTMLVKADISSASPASTSTADQYIAFDVESTSDVVATDEDGNTVDPSGAPVNGGNSTDASVNPTTDFGIASYGSFAVAAASDTPDKGLVVMGTSDNEISKFKLTGTDEGWYLETFSVLLNDGQESGEGDTAYLPNFDGLKLKYQTEDQWGSENWTISSEQVFGSNASRSFNFSGDSRIYVPKDDSSYVTVLADIRSYNGGNGAYSKTPFKLLPVSGSINSFLAYGAQSGKQLVTFTEPSESGFNLHFVTRSKPVFAKSAWDGGETELARFTITAEGYDVFFDGIDGHDTGDEEDIATACLAFDVIASTTLGAGEDSETSTFYLYDWNETIVSSDAITWNTTNNAGNGTSISFAFEESDVTIPEGTTKEFHVDIKSADLTDIQKTDEYIYLQLKNDDGDNRATGSMGFGERNIVWDDGTADEGISGQGDPEERFGMPELIKNIGPLPITFRTYRGTATP
ncbi:MAG: hypothetical protein GF387_01425 [Candidatus Portnoybacteria bacterium]|nr:hypothetical protein [Candidatus Portnoybacteria bacterium]